ncbi:MAG: hypothetical protein AMXMBFR23_03740 [Chloroflexota bacterium]
MPTLADARRRASAALAAARALGGALASEASHRAFPVVEGRATVAGIEAAIEIVRDRHGVPHVFASSAADAAFGQGYVHAQDRLFQMEGARRLAGGRLAEVGGARLLGSDRLMRRIGLHRAARRDAAAVTGEVAALLEAYARGVNAGVAVLPALPPEFVLLGRSFEPWSVADTMLVARLVTFGFAGNWNTELIRERLAAALGPEVAAALDPVHPTNGTVTGRPYAADAAARLQEAYREAVVAGLPSGLASNAWAVSAARTGTGMPLLAGDPHVDVTLPCLFHVAHVQGGDLEVAGASVPGIPGVLMGHNRRVAWSITAGMADVADCFIETFEAPDSPRYRTPEGWATAEEHLEVIEVQGGAPVTERVFVTRHGPVVGPALAGETRAIAMRSVVVEGGDLATPFAALWRAASVAEVDRALLGWAGTTFNFVMADVDGRIGYRMAGGVPQRGRGEGLLPQDGATSPGPASLWPGEMLPAVFDPADGIVVSANNAPGSDLELGEEWCEPRRAERIRDLVEVRDRHDVASFAAIQRDRYSANLHRLARVLLERGAVAGELAARLEPWDGVLAPESAEAALLAETWRTLARHLAQRIGGAQGAGVIGSGAGGTQVNSAFSYRIQGPLVEAAEAASYPWFEGEDDRDRQLRGAVERAVATLTRTCGEPSRWTLGAVHRIHFVHSLDGVPAVGPRFSRGSHPFGGDSNTVLQGMSPAWRERSKVAVAPGFRQVLDLADWDASVFMVPTGQSGIPGHPRYDDCIPEYLRGAYRPLLFSRAAVRAASEATLVLAPAAGGGA